MVVAWISVVLLDLGISQFGAVVQGQLKLDTVWIPVFIINVDGGWCFDCGVNDVSSGENAILGVEVLDGWHTLSVHQVGSGKSFNFPVLQGAILVVEAFAAGTS